MWAEYDVGLHSEFLADLYKAQGDWPHDAEMDDQAAQYYKDLVEHNPTVATFTKALVERPNGRVEAAEHENDASKSPPGRRTPWRSGTASWSSIRTCQI